MLIMFFVISACEKRIIMTILEYSNLVSVVSNLNQCIIYTSVEKCRGMDETTNHLANDFDFQLILHRDFDGPYDRIFKSIVFPSTLSVYIFFGRNTVTKIYILDTHFFSSQFISQSTFSNF